MVSIAPAFSPYAYPTHPAPAHVARSGRSVPAETCHYVGHRKGSMTRHVDASGQTSTSAHGAGHGGGLPSPTGRLLDLHNTNSDLRRGLDRARFDGVTSHGCRKTVATQLDEAGLSARQIADHLGRIRPSRTQDVHMGRGPASLEAAPALQRS